MWWALLLPAGIVGFELDMEDPTISEVSDCLLFIAENYLDRRCLAFLFPFNFSDPSLVDVPPLVRSPLLKKMDGRWISYLPAVNPYRMFNPFMKPKPGPSRMLHCAHIVILDETSCLVDQIEEMMYKFYSHYYQHGGGEKTRMVVAVSRPIKEFEIYELLSYMFQRGDLDVILVGIVNNTVTVSTLFPYGKDRDTCQRNNNGSEILDFWVNGAFTRNVDLFPEKLPEKFNNCSLRVGTYHNPPYFIVNQEGKPSGGINHGVLELIAERLGMNIDYRIYNRSDAWLWMEDDGPKGLSTDLRLGLVWITAAGDKNLVFTFPSLIIPHPFMTEHICFFFKNPKEVATWKLIFIGFNDVVWIVLIATAFAFPCCLFLLARFQNYQHPFQKFSISIMSSYALLVSFPSSVDPRTIVFRLAFATWFFYTIHINLAYSAALKSLLTAGKTEPKMASFEQLLEENLKMAVTQNVLYQTAQMDEPVIKDILANHIVVESYKVIYNQLKKYGNLSFLDIDLPFSYTIKKNNLSMYKSDLCLRFFYLGLMLRRNHFIIQKVANLSFRIAQSGFPEKFIKNYVEVPSKPNEVKLRAFSIADLSGPFLILIIGYTLSLGLFVGEITFYLVKKYLSKRSIQTFEVEFF
ncbi:ionotropic receptor 21a-like [Halyomorpha halys]|uniref:ionotropic receptor 21a-like n=1 Tax=Halyomorpha halys TaxID=286706 RepID=UPI0034D2EF0B|nr:Ionotropic receptor 108 [Halyomorpha halys]